MVDCLREVGNVSDTYAHAKRALNASAPERVVCRNKENEELQDILVSCFQEKKTTSLYVNGQPGTGKTLTVTSVLESLHVSTNFICNLSYWLDLTDFGNVLGKVPLQGGQHQLHVD